MIVTEQRQFEQWVLTEEGSEVIQNGSHEARVYNAVDAQNGTSQAHIMVSGCGLNYCWLFCSRILL